MMHAQHNIAAGTSLYSENELLQSERKNRVPPRRLLHLSVSVGVSLSLNKSSLELFIHTCTAL